MQLQVKTILNAIQHFPGFVFQDIHLQRHWDGRPSRIEIAVEPHGGIPAKCSRCLRSAPGYDRLPQRSWLFVPLWGIQTFFLFAARRVQCATHGVVVEHVPWSNGKRPVTLVMMCFLSRWARRLSWRETARAFHTSWECVYRSVEWFLQWGLAHRRLEGVQSIGVDEIHWGKSKRADNFLTVIYQIDIHCRRLLWVGKRRTQATLRRGLAALGQEVVQGLRFVCSDMWRPYLGVIAAQVGQALHVLDRFHITSHLNQALDQVRRAESGQLRAAGLATAERLKNMRWKLLRRHSRVRGRARRGAS
jgi:transposase